MPGFRAGAVRRVPFEKEGHQLYYYLLDGQLPVQARRVEDARDASLLRAGASSASRCASCSSGRCWPRRRREWYCGSKAFYDVAPRDPERFKLYEEAIDKNLAAYADRRERQHDFGMLNYGDWYGERGTNWGNIEYDTQHAFFLEYIRSGNPDAFFLGDATELHNRDIDTVQWSEDPQRSRRRLRPPDVPRGRLLRQAGARHPRLSPRRIHGQPRLDRGAFRPLLPHRRPPLLRDGLRRGRLLHPQGARPALRFLSVAARPAGT